VIGLYLAGDPAVKALAVMLMIVLAGYGVLSIVRPDITWWFQTAMRSWQYSEDPEPSDGALLMQRIGGAALIVGVVYFAWKAFFAGT